MMKKQKDEKTLTTLKVVALVMALAAILLVVSMSMAAGGAGGETPVEAVVLDADVNSGHLEPLEQHWFKFVPDPEGREIDVEKTITLVFTPNEAFTANFIDLNIFPVEEIPYFSNGDSSNMSAVGVGSVVEQDGKPETGEQIWSGFVYGPRTYYVQILNNSDFPIDYDLYNSAVDIAELEEPEQPPEEVDQPPLPVEEELTPAGVDPANPNAINYGGVTKGKLEAGKTGWYEFSYPDPDNKREIKELEFTIFYTPVDGNERHNVTFELFPASEVNYWMRGDGAEGMTNFGAGQLVNRTSNAHDMGNGTVPGQRLWSGGVYNGDRYLISVKNGTGHEIDYWLFEGDVYDVELGEPTVVKAKVYDPGQAPTTALPVKLGENVGHLEPGEQAWHSFFITDFDNEAFEQMALTMIATPDMGNNGHYVTFEVFTPDGVQYWSDADIDNSRVTNMGAGSLVFRDDNKWTIERAWNGWVLDNNLYLVQVMNGGDVAIDYHLFTGDVYGPPLGAVEEKPAVEIAAEPGTSRGAALDFQLGLNKGQLNPGEEVWYSFVRSDVAPGGGNTAFTVVVTPNDGNRVHNIGMELYAGNDPNSFGTGSVVERDNEVFTGELLWIGQVMPNSLYYMKVTNGSDVVMEYWIFPDDVINANLE
jgi:hypothetical protein